MHLPAHGCAALQGAVELDREGTPFVLCCAVAEPCTSAAGGKEEARQGNSSPGEHLPRIISTTLSWPSG